MTDYVTPVMQSVFQTALYVDATDAILLMVVCVSIIFSIQDYRIGLISLLLLSASSYIFFTLNGFLISHATMLLLLSVLLMAVSFFITKKPGGALLA